LASNNADPAIPWYRTMAGSLGIVLALVGALYVCVRRWMPSQTAAESGLLRVVARSHLSPKQGVALIQLGRRFVLVGVSPGRLQPLSEITDPEEVADLTVREATGSATRKDYSRFEAILQGRAGEFEQPSAPPTDFAPARRSPAAGSSPGLGDLVRRLKSLQT
jgi:flagellar biogenesis protein FliO